MANTRFKGANSSERLTLSTLSDSDMFQTRHLPGTVNDADKGVSKALLQALPVAVCATAAATAAKVGTLAPESCPDFTLVNGRVIHVYFSAANTASVPTINVAGTGAIPITYPNGDYVGAWAAGTTMDLMYISITVDNTAMERWVVTSSLPVDEVALNNMHSVSSNAVALAFKGMEVVECGKIDNDKGFYIKYACGLMEQWNYRTFGNTTLNQMYNIYSAYVTMEFTKPYKVGTVPIQYSGYVPTTRGASPSVWFGNSNDGSTTNTEMRMEIFSFYPYNLSGIEYYVYTVGFWK